MNEGSNSLFGEGLFGIILFLIVAGVFNGGGFFGGNRGVDQVTNEFLFNNLANQNRDIMAGINNVDRDVLTTSCNTDKEILESRYTTQLGFQNLGSSVSDCCCSIKQEMAANTQKILDKMCENEINSLRDALNTANLQLSQQAQSANLISQLRPFPQPAYLTASPYTAYGYNGCYGCTNI